MKHKLLLTLAAAGVATAVVAARRRQARLVAPLVPDEWRTDPDDYFDNDPINTRNAGAPIDGDEMHDVNAETLGLVRAIDEQQIEAAEQALARPDLDPALSAFAEMMLADHSESLAAAQALQIEPVATAEVTDFGERRGDRLDALDDLDGDDYADAFLQAIVEGHQEALAMLDRALPEVADDDVRAFLATARGHLAHHLQRGRELHAQR